VEVSVSAYPQGDGLSWVAPIVASFTYDVSAPKLLGVKLDSPIWKAGEVHQVLFKATDENAGVSLATSYVNLTRTGGADTWINSDLGAKRLENDWYAQKITVSKFQAPGKYCVDHLQSSDRAGNYSFLKRAHESQSVYEYSGDLAKTYPTNIPVACVTVENPGLADSAPPMLLEVRAPEAVWDTTKDHRLSFRVSDDVSGVKVDEISCSYDADKFTCSDPRDEGGGWFSVKVKLNPYLAEQELKISGLSFKDNAGNGSDYTDDLEKGTYGYRRSLAPGKWPNAMDSGVPVFTQRVKNFGQVDTTAPQFLGIDAPAPLRAGHSGRVRFKARDEGSGLLLKTAESDLQVMDVILIPIADNKGKSLWLSTHEIVAEGNDWYHADFFISPFAAAGEYFVWTTQVRDRAYNEALSLRFPKGSPPVAPFQIIAKRALNPLQHVSLVFASHLKRKPGGHEAEYDAHGGDRHFEAKGYAAVLIAGSKVTKAI
jgi:hypothetical protein